LKIISLDVDFSGIQNIQTAVLIQNEYFELLQESASIDDEHIAAAIQHYCDEKSRSESEPADSAGIKIISVFINKDFYKNFELVAEVCVIHSAAAIESLPK
jgi:deoxyhypusine synthase